MTLNDTEVQRQVTYFDFFIYHIIKIRHMMAFIDQEAREKVEEIDAKVRWLIV